MLSVFIVHNIPHIENSHIYSKDPPRQKNVFLPKIKLIILHYSNRLTTLTVEAPRSQSLLGMFSKK